ncbi:hypothetical protein ACFU8I_07465, partial [Streptomyces sp. NPDC057540]
MRFRHRDGTAVHLGHLTDVREAGSLDEIVGGLAAHAEPVRRGARPGRRRPPGGGGGAPARGPPPPPP